MPNTQMIDHTKRGELFDFGVQIICLPVADKIKLAAYLVNNGLMLPKGLMAKSLWWVVNFVAKRRGLSPVTLYEIVISKSDGQIAKDTIFQTVDWMINGKDTSDSRSAGGFNADEIEAIRSFVESLR